MERGTNQMRENHHCIAPHFHRLVLFAMTKKAITKLVVLVADGVR